MRSSQRVLAIADFMITLLLALLLTVQPCFAQADRSCLPEATLEASLNATQIVGVAWTEGASALLTLYEKQEDGTWSASLNANAFIGANGLGKTKEGDKKTPEGVFCLSTPFGILEDPGARMAGYVQVTDRHYWSGASGTLDYNRLIDLSVRADYEPTSNDEHLIDYPNEYAYALFIEYNKEGVENAGSAIFLHCKGKKTYTSGCIAVDRDDMIRLMQKLGDEAVIVIYAE